MGLRELLILILILAIVGVILRGLYVALRARRGQLRMALEKNVPQYDPDELALSELPNGGARMVERSFAEVVRQNSEFSSRQSKAKSDHAIPVLMDSVEDEDDEEVRPNPGSGVASARQAARQKHLLGTARPRPVQRPTHRPIDRMARSAVAAAPVASSPAPATPQSSPRPAETGFDLDYDDPLDSHVFKDTDDAYDEYADYEQSQDDELPAPVLRENAAAAWEREEEEYNEGGLEESIDEAVAEVEGQSPDAVITQAFEEAYAEDDQNDDLDDEYLDDEELDDEDLESDDSDAEFDDEPDDEFDDEVDPDDDYYDDDEENDLDNDDLDDEEDLDDEYEEADEAEAFESVYADDDEDDFSDDDYVDEQMDEQKSGPRRWLQWAGDKLASMSAATAEESSRPERKREQQREDRLAERAEPTIGAGSFDEVFTEPATPVAPVREREAVRPKAAAPLAPSQQSELNLDEPAPVVSDRRNHAPANPVLDDSVLFESSSDDAGHMESAAASVEPTPPAKPRTQARTPEPEPEPAIAPDYSEVLVFNIFAKPDREFAGVDLLQTLLAAGLHFGEMSIFHRHLGSDPSSPVVFSVANLVNPGTFDLNQISAFSTKGLCFFMTLPNVANSMQAFDKMLDAAQQIRIGLDGDLKDDNRSVMTAQTIEHYRQRVRDFELRQLRQPK